LRFSEQEGEFAAGDVIVKGANNKGRLRRRSDGYDFIITRGTQIILR
jgi:hypothetical protein